MPFQICPKTNNVQCLPDLPFKLVYETLIRDDLAKKHRPKPLPTDPTWPQVRDMFGLAPAKLVEDKGTLNNFTL